MYLRERGEFQEGKHSAGLEPDLSLTGRRRCRGPGCAASVPTTAHFMGLESENHPPSNYIDFLGGGSAEAEVDFYVQEGERERGKVIPDSFFPSFRDDGEHRPCSSIVFRQESSGTHLHILCCRPAAACPTVEGTM